MDAVLSHILNLLRQKKAVARAVIVSSEGSSPRTSGSCMVADEHGLLTGSVGGGALEGQGLALVKQVLRENSRIVRDIDLHGKSDADMICGGSISLLVEALPLACLPHFEALALALQQQGEVWSILDLGTGARQVIAPRHAGLSLPIQVALSSAIASRHDTALVSDENTTWLLECWHSSPVMLFAGGGHVAQAAAAMAGIAGFSVMVMDDRPAFANAQRFPSASSCHVVPDYLQCFDHIALSTTFLIILTRGHAYDTTVLEQALLRHRIFPFAYIGMIGSTRKRDLIYADLLQKGFAAAELDIVHCPVGLPIHAETPGEIAVSIVAQCVEHRRKVGL